MKVMYYKLDVEPEVAHYIRAVDYDTCFVSSVNDATGEIKLRQGTFSYIPGLQWGSSGEKRLFGWKKDDLVTINIESEPYDPTTDEKTAEPLVSFKATLLTKITEREFLTSLGVICKQ